MRSKFAFSLAVLALTVSAPAVAQEVITGPPALTGSEFGWAYSGIEFQALQDVSLVSFTFNNQGNSDNILLLDESWNTVHSISTAAGQPVSTVSVDWLLNGGDVYRLVRTTQGNSLYDSYNGLLPQNDHLAITNSGFFSNSLTSTGSFDTNDFWSTFTNITTVNGVASAVPEPATWAMMLLGFGAVGFQLRRRKQPSLA
ncbi:MAG TPA: PEPxxWA-CTERM sorting domain-containing protein [Nitrospira sp.]|nr:PEPxxWA-CTERM sorting domain-containing protein [Nitrospira sp.]